MTRPRRHIAGQVVMLTRRCFERRFFLRPDHYINAVVGFEFGRAAVRHGLDVHAVMTMSNHPHLIVTDTKGKRSGFMRDAMSGIARARNFDLERSSFFWGENR
jgi:putative transposase